MEFYKSIKRIAAIGVLATIPYACNSCNYSDNRANAENINVQQTVQQQTITTTESLEKILE